MNSIHLTRERSLYATFAERSIQARQLELARLREQIGTGLKINRASDDPTGYGQARRLEVLSDRYEGYVRSIGAARTWVDHTQKTLDELTEFFVEAQERGVRIANGTFSDGDREAYAQRLEHILKTIPDQLNARCGDEYLFAGSRSTVKPFDHDPGPESDGAGIVYRGNEGERNRQVGDQLALRINISGDRLWNFDSSGDGTADTTLTEALQGLIDAVRTADPAAMNDALHRTGQARDHVIHLAAEAGNVAARLTLAEDQLRTGILLVDQRRSSVEDADFAETLMNAEREQTALNAALKVTASISQYTLLDFLR
jgi:flagellar hook-associated protein 3 FlgL